MKIPGTDRMKISANYIWKVGLISKIYERLRKLNSKKLNNTIKTWAKGHEETFHKRYIDGNINEKMSKILVIPRTES